MEEMITILCRIGLSADEVARIKEQYLDDLDGLKRYVMYMRAMFDDRHEYLD